jgi:hypothetical protein
MDKDNLNQNTPQPKPPAIPKKESSEDKGFLIRPIRTYQDDVAKFVKDKKVSTAQIVLAEQNRKQNINSAQPKKTLSQVKAVNVAPKPEQKNYSKILKPLFKTLVATLLIFGGLAVLYYVYDSGIIQKQISNVTAPKISNTEKLIEKENRILIDTTGKQISKIQSEIFAVIENTTLDIEKGITEIQIIKTTEDGSSELITTNNFFQIFNTNISDKTLRSLDESFLIGLHNIDNTTQTNPFIIFKTNEFEQVFSEMFDWEFYLVNDFKNIFADTLKTTEIIPETTTESSTTTATSTIENTDAEELSTSTTDVVLIDPQPEFDPRDFKDLILNNHDTRAIIDTKGNIRFLYGFIGDEFLIITNDSETFKEVSRRLRIQELRR